MWASFCAGWATKTRQRQNFPGQIAGVAGISRLDATGQASSTLQDVFPYFMGADIGRIDIADRVRRNTG